MQQTTHQAPAAPRQQVVNQFQSIKDFQTQGLLQQGQQPPVSSGSGVTSSAAQSSEAAASTLGAAAVFRALLQGPPSRADDHGPQFNEDVSDPEMNS